MSDNRDGASWRATFFAFMGMFWTIFFGFMIVDRLSQPLTCVPMVVEASADTVGSHHEQ